MTKHSASHFSHFALCAGLILSATLSACTHDDWITQECVTLAQAECQAQPESQCRFHDLLKLAAETKHSKPVRITPRYAQSSRKATPAKPTQAVITPRIDTPESIDFTDDAQTPQLAQADMPQANTHDGFDFTNDAQTPQLAQADMPQANTTDGFDFTNDAQTPQLAQAEMPQANTADGFDFTEDTQFLANAIPSAHKTYAPAIQPNDIENTGCIDINTADIPELMRLPGIGHARAQAIVTSRQSKSFKRKKDIRRIKGIGPKSYIKLAALICDI